MKKVAFCLLAMCCSLLGYADDVVSTGEIWPDDRDIHINAHGGGILYHEGTYYWFGEHKSERTSNALVGVNCYSSQNLKDWTYRGVALSVSNEKGSDIESGCIIERPKVVYNAKTGKFVMWFHLELKDMGYLAARAAVAIADKPEGPYTFIRSERVCAYHYPMDMTEEEIKGLDTLTIENKKGSALTDAVKKGYYLKRDFSIGQMARDQTVYVDDDGKAYHIFASEENYTLHIAELSEDYTFHTGRYKRIAPAGRNEAPAIMKRNGKYWMITSGLSGWSPNKARMFSADNIWGPWTQHDNPCVGSLSEITFSGQGTYILKVEGKDEYIFMADIWRPRHPIDARYIWLPITYKADGTPVVEWIEQPLPNTPTMGWSSWNTYRVNISDSLICSQAETMRKLGLKDLGYRFVNIDDGFFGGRNADGSLKINEKKFPRGMKPVADYIHSRGLKAGIYSDAGHNTCGSQYDNDTLGIGVGLYGHEAQDAELFFRDWGYDFIKIDYCGAKKLKLDEREQYTRIRKAIDAVGRKDVRINVCRWAFPGTWVSEIGSSWRIFADISPRWSRIRDIIFRNLYLSAYAVDGHFNDMDMLEISRGLKPEEEQTHMAVWCIMSSPLLIGCDLNKIKRPSLDLLRNHRLIALNQDPLLRQAEYVDLKDSVVLMAKDIKVNAGLERAFAVVNLSDREQKYTVALDRQLYMAGKVEVTNAVSGKQTTNEGEMQVVLPPHATHIFTVKAERRLEQQRYEAENAWLNNYQDIRAEKCATIENGYAVNVGGSADNWMEWKNITMQRGGKRKLTINYRSSEARQMVITVNGKSQTVKSPAAKDGGKVVVKVDIRKGEGNSIRISNDNDEIPDIDSIELI